MLEIRSIREKVINLFADEIVGEYVIRMPHLIDKDGNLIMTSSKIELLKRAMIPVKVISVVKKTEYYLEIEIDYIFKKTTIIINTPFSRFSINYIVENFEKKLKDYIWNDLYNIEQDYFSIFNLQGMDQIVFHKT